jgi:hypothetical protein
MKEKCIYELGIVFVFHLNFVFELGKEPKL